MPFTEVVTRVKNEAATDVVQTFATHTGNWRAKWSDAWYIYSHDDYGPRFAIYRDSTAKKVEISIGLRAVAGEIRFGSTSHRSAGRPSSTTKDVRVHDSCFMSIPIERTSKKTTTHETLWLCTTSVLELYDLVKLFSYSLTVVKDRPPPCYHEGADSVFSLHRYRPIAFIAETDWERFYDTPPQQTLFKQRDVPLINRSSSVDVIGEKITLRGLRGKLLKSERKKATKSLTVFSESSNHEYDEVPESCCEKRGSIVHQTVLNEGNVTNEQSEIRCETMVLKASPDDVTLNGHAPTTRSECSCQQTLTVDRESLDEYSVVCTKQQNGSASHQVVRISETDVHCNTGSSESFAEPDSPPHYTANVSQSLCTETLETLIRSRELNEKPIPAPKPNVAHSPPPSPSYLVYKPIMLTSTPSAINPVIPTPPNTENSVFSKTDVKRERAMTDDGVMTTVSFTLKQTQRTTVDNSPISPRPHAASFTISDLKVEGGGGLRALSLLPSRPTAPIAVTKIIDEQDFPLMKLYRSKEYDEVEEMDWREEEMKGFAVVDARPSTGGRSRMRCCSAGYEGPVPAVRNCLPNGVSKVIELSL